MWHPGGGGAGAVEEMGGPKPAARWYPVVDYSRCSGCRQCADFCLFGVYSAEKEGGVRVVRPDNCKTGCPACARVCPQSAIIFAEYEDAEIAGADQAVEGVAAGRDRAAEVEAPVPAGGPAPAGKADRSVEAGDGGPHDELDDLMDALDAMDEF